MSGTFYGISNGSHPTDLAFLSITQHQLGQPVLARVVVARLRERGALQQDPRWADDADAQAFLREAEALIEGNR